MSIYYLFAALFICDIVLGEYIPPGPKYTCPENGNTIYPCVCLRGTDEGLYISCNDTNLAALSVSIQSLANLDTKIESISISECLIEKLYGPLFHKSSIRVITIMNTPIDEISAETFLGVNDTLQELRIINSRLPKFPKEAMNVLGNLVVLSLDQHFIDDLPKDTFAESLMPNSLERIYISNGNVSNIEPETFQAFRKLKVLDVHGNNLTALKKNQFKNLRNLESLDLSHNDLKKFDASHIFDLTKLGWCNVTHNSIAEIARGTFARSSLLKWLDFSHNQLKKVDGSSFRGMRFLRRLYLNDNSIVDVGRGAFTAVPRIGTVNLARNALKKVDYQMFYQLNYVEEINLAENNITTIEKEAFKDLYLAKINISHNGLENVEPQAFLNCVNMTILDLSHNNLRTIKRYAFDDISYASDLLVSYNFFEDLSHVPIHNMTGLRILNVSHNALTTIPKNTFPKLYELHTVDLSYNNLSSIFGSVFQNLFSLRFVNLSHNSLTNLNLTTFGPLTTVLELDLNNNRLTTVHRNCFTKMSSLQSLWMENNLMEQLMFIPISLNRLFFRNNSVTSFIEKQWPTMNSLLYLDMTDNRLGDSLEETSFSGLLTLQNLFLIRNNLTVFPKQALSTLTTLRYLRLEGNHIKELDKNSLGRMNTLFELDLFNNEIASVGAKVFEGLPQLVILNMSHNAISNLSMETFTNLVSLNVLDLSHNEIERLDNKTNGLLDPLYSLRAVNLSHNKFSTLHRYTFPSNPYVPYKLEKVDLSYNLMSYIPVDLKYGTSKLMELDLSHNQINGINQYVIGNLTMLKVLDLSYNDLNDDKKQFTIPENLTELYFTNNNLQYLPVAKLGAKLEKLHLNGNDFSDISEKVIEKVLKNKLQIDYEGNPVNCDCHVRPLKNFIEQFPKPPEHLRSIRCYTPSLIADEYLVDVDEALLICPNGAQQQGKEIEPIPDIKFRKVFSNNGVLSVFWYVTGNRDIADFAFLIRHTGTGDLIYEDSIAYNKRSAEVRQDKLKGTNLNDMQLCIVAKRSNHELGSFSGSQCVQAAEALRDGNSNRNFYRATSTTAHSNAKRLSSTGAIILLPLLLLLMHSSVAILLSRRNCY